MDDDGAAAPTPLPDGTGTTPSTGPDDPERSEAIAEISESTLPHVMPRNDWKRLLVRVAVSVGFLSVLIWRLPSVSISKLIPVFTGAAVGWLVVAVAVHVVAYLLQTLRWGQVSDTLGIHLPYRRLLSHLMAGEFVSNALPTSFGGDVVRVMRQGRDAGDFADAFASTSLERLTGWLVLPLLSLLGLLLDPSLLGLGAATTVAVIVNIVTVVALIAILWVAGHERGAGRLVGRAGWRRYLGAVHLGIVAFRHRPGRILRVLLAGVGFQFLQCVSVWCCARALGIPQVTILAAMAFFPPTAVVQNFPLALGGLGVREAAFVLFFGALGVSNTDAIALGLTVYLVFIVASLAGAPSFAVGGRGATVPGASAT